MPLAPPATLTPTKATAFSDCPFAFRRSVIDGVRTPPTRPLAVGTLVHAALEDFYRREPDRRSEAALNEAVDTAVRAAACDDELGAYVAELDDRERAALYRSITTLSRTILDLEDPARVRAIGTELRLEATIEGVHVRGVIDRLDLDDEGDLVVVDYKTGRTPTVPSRRAARRCPHLRPAGVGALRPRTPSRSPRLPRRRQRDRTRTERTDAPRGRHTPSRALARDRAGLRPRGLSAPPLTALRELPTP